MEPDGRRVGEGVTGLDVTNCCRRELFLFRTLTCHICFCLTTVESSAQFYV